MSLSPAISLVVGSHVVRNEKYPDDAGMQYIRLIVRVLQDVAQTIPGNKREGKIIILVENSALPGMPVTHRERHLYLTLAAQRLQVSFDTLVVQVARGEYPSGFQNLIQEDYDRIRKPITPELRTTGDVHRVFGSDESWREIAAEHIAAARNEGLLKLVKADYFIEVIPFETIVADIRETAAKLVVDTAIRGSDLSTALENLPFEIKAYDDAALRRDELTAQEVTQLYRNSSKKKVRIVVLRGAGHRYNLERLLTGATDPISVQTHAAPTFEPISPIDQLYRSGKSWEDTRIDDYPLIHEIALRCCLLCSTQPQSVQQQTRLNELIKGAGEDRIREWFLECDRRRDASFLVDSMNAMLLNT